MDKNMTLEKRIAAELYCYQGKMSVFVDDLQGHTVEVGADEEFETASTIKAFILAALYLQAQRGKADLAEEITYEQSQFVDGSGMLRALGVEFRCGVEVGKDITIAQLREEGYKGFYVAIGAQKSAKLGVAGEELTGVYGGVDFLRAVNLGEQPAIGKRCAVIGGGNTAIDVARTVRRMGAEPLVVYRRTRDRAPAHQTEIQEAIEEGVNMKWLSTIREAQGGEIKIEKMELDENGKPHESLNHYSYGAICGWLFGGVCGIRYTDGALTIAPTPDKSLDWAKATYDSPAGRIVSGWRYDGDVVTYEFEIPANLTADVTLTDGRKFTLAPGKHTV